MNTTTRDPSWEEDEISLKEKVGYTHLISVGEREWIVLDEDEGSISFH
jgi:hypothetical protein